MSADTLHNRKNASKYLIEKYGPGGVTPATLAKLAVLGGGPIMHRFNRRVAYLESDLDGWAKSRCSGPMRSTSDHEQSVEKQR